MHFPGYISPPPATAIVLANPAVDLLIVSYVNGRYLLNEKHNYNNFNNSTTPRL
ncbi:hypothetical protein JCM21142_104558 [Saccharicrinis fermentans DSM 9555 = JCM 21142]|uniref:Uncharacterized protein n=1 Tax=Saccharicrinis fermentans DSM 9555 = JCM 21142 TaxID=869213 RepID=W7Y4H9_9BACT|nr:hypothetical protein JCM21142_104558 [Saccharicrinis fermentans DSM 9555 = JCM 21142]